MPTPSTQDLEYCNRLIDARRETLQTNLKLLNHYNDERVQNIDEETFNCLKSLIRDFIGYDEQTKNYLNKISIEEAKEDKSLVKAASQVLFAFKKSLNFYDDILVLVEKYKAEPIKHCDRKQDIIDEIISCIYDGLYYNKLIKLQQHYRTIKVLLEYGLKEKLPEGLIASNNINQESLSETEYLEELFNYLQDYASPKQRQALDFLTQHIEEQIKITAKNDNLNDQTKVEFTNLADAETSDFNFYVNGLKSIFHPIIRRLEIETINFNQQANILGPIINAKESREIKIFGQKITPEFRKLVIEFNKIKQLQDAYEFKIKLATLWQQLQEFKLKLTKYQESFNFIQQAAQKIKQNQVQPDSQTKETPKGAKEVVVKNKVKAKAKPDVVQVAVSNFIEDDKSLQQAQEKLTQEAKALAQEQERIREEQKLAETEALNQAARIKRAQERQEKAVLFRERMPLEAPVLITNTNLDTQESSILFKKLSARNLKKLEEILNATAENINLTFTYSHLAAIAEDLDAKIKEGSGSRRKFVFSNFDFDTYEPSRVIYPVHNPHGKAHETGALFGVYVEQFIGALNKIGINKASLDNYKCSLKAPRLVL